MKKSNGFVRLLGAIAVCACPPLAASADATSGGAGPQSDGVVHVSDAAEDGDGLTQISDETSIGVPPAPAGAGPLPPETSWQAEPAHSETGIYQPLVTWDAAGPVHECPPYGADGYGTYDGGVYDGGAVDGWNFFEPGVRPLRRGWFAGGGVVSLEADFDANTAFFIQDSTGPVDVITSQEFGYDIESGFRTWLGYQDGTGMAYRVTYFDYDASASESAVAPANFVFFNGLETPTTIGRLLAGGTAGDVVNAQSELDIYYIDAEITQELNFDRWQTTFGGGYRHVSMAQRYAAVATAGGVFVRSEVGQRFEGHGPTIFGEVRIPFLGYGDRRYVGSAGLSVFGHARASILFGDTNLTAVDVNPTLPGVTIAGADLSDTDSMKIGEIRVGGQFDVRPIDGTLVYVIVAYEAQWLDGANDFADINEDNDLALHGWYFAVGADW